LIIVAIFKDHRRYARKTSSAHLSSFFVMRHSA